MAEEFAATIDDAVRNKLINGGAAIAVSKTGETLFSKAFGKTSLRENAEDWKFDSTFWIASSSKLLTSISVLQCVAKGLLHLDEDVSSVLPEFANPQILTGFDADGSPQLTSAKTTLTLRKLLTHASGLAYYGPLNALITEYRDKLSLPNDSGTFADYTQPLVFEPGKGWEYGPSLDWAGQMVERVTGMTLEAYIQKHICEPLGMTQTTFNPLKNEAVMSHMVGRVGRNEHGNLIEEPTGAFPVADKKANFGGNGLYSSAQDYIKVLTSILTNDGKLLQGEMYDELFRPQLSAESVQGLEGFVKHPIFGTFFAAAYPRTEDTRWNHALGGAIIDKEISGQAAKGTLFWSGLPNNYWFIDRENGVCGYYASWILGPGDRTTGQMMGALQQAAVKEAQRH